MKSMPNGHTCASPFGSVLGWLPIRPCRRRACPCRAKCAPARAGRHRPWAPRIPSRPPGSVCGVCVIREGMWTKIGLRVMIVDNGGQPQGRRRQALPKKTEAPKGGQAQPFPCADWSLGTRVPSRREPSPAPRPPHWGHDRRLPERRCRRLPSNGGRGRPDRLIYPRAAGRPWRASSSASRTA